MDLSRSEMTYVEMVVESYYKGRRERSRGGNSRAVLVVSIAFVLTLSVAVVAGIHLSLGGESFLELPAGLIVGAFLLMLLVMFVVCFQRQCARERAWNLTNAELKSQIELCMSQIKRLPAARADSRLLIDFLRDFQNDPDTALQKARHVSDSPALMSLTFIQDILQEYFFVEHAV